MNNPGIDLDVWKRLNKKWTDLHADGHYLRIEFKLVVDPDNETKVVLIDVIQNIDGQIVVETVQKNTGEAYAMLGIDKLSIEQLVQNYKKLADSMYQQIEKKNTTLIVTMLPKTAVSGETQAVMINQNINITTDVQANYRHYCVLNALREKMVDQLGERWSKVTAIYREENLEFHFDYT